MAPKAENSKNLHWFFGVFEDKKNLLKLSDQLKKYIYKIWYFLTNFQIAIHYFVVVPLVSNMSFYTHQVIQFQIQLFCPNQLL